MATSKSDTIRIQIQAGLVFLAGVTVLLLAILVAKFCMTLV